MRRRLSTPLIQGRHAPPLPGKARFSGVPSPRGLASGEQIWTRPQRWPLVGAGGARWPPARRRLVAVLGAIALGAVAAAPVFPTALRCALGAVAIGLLAAARPPRPRRAPPGSSWIVADDEGLSRVDPAGATPIVRWGSPFGVTLLASYGRPHALLAFTTEAEARYVPTRIDGRSELDDALLARVAVLTDLDFIDGVIHEAALSPDDAAALARCVEEHDPRALGRVLLSGGGGEPVRLDGATLSVARCSFDLTSPLEWRPLMFHESIGQTAALYQATWIRQHGAEVVLVAPMPASILPRERREVTGRVGQALTRDLRLLPSPSEPPPLRELRVAIDRPFMLALRRALADAPFASRVVSPAPKAAQEEGRGSHA